jgi:hypothetical protein
MQSPRSTFAFRGRTDRCLLDIPQAREGAPDECDRERASIGVIATPRFQSSRARSLTIQFVANQQRR